MFRLYRHKHYHVELIRAVCSWTVAVLELERELREAQSCILELRTTIGSLLNSTSNVTTVLQPCEAPHTVKLGIEDIAEPGSRDMETLRSSETPPPFSVAKDEVCFDP